MLDDAVPAARVINLETGVTEDGDFAPGKGIHYRMHPANLPCLTAARPDVCVLANNHVLDFGRQGLADTLDALAGAGLRTAGAGADAGAARRPAVVPLEGGRRILVFSFGMPSSGIPGSWAATGDRAGVDFVARPSSAAATGLVGRVRQVKRPGDVAVVSVHWGPTGATTCPVTRPPSRTYSSTAAWMSSTDTPRTIPAPWRRTGGSS